MTAEDQRYRDHRVLILAPRGRDAAVIGALLLEAGQTCTTCESLQALLDQLREGGGAAFVTEASLDGAALQALQQWLSEQPPWSDFPFAVLATKQSGRRSVRQRETLAALGNVVLLEMPLNAETLVSAARSMLRSRSRQYEARSHLEQQQRISHENVRLYEAERAAVRETGEARQALSFALDAADLGTFHCAGVDGEMTWNETGKRHLWLQPDARVDLESFFAIVHPDERAATRAAFVAATQGRRLYDVEFRALGPGSSSRWLRAKGRGHYTSDGRLNRFDGVTIDISRQKELEAARERSLEIERSAREQAEHASRMKDEFLATLSHELRTPLSAILGWTRLLQMRAKGSAEILKGIDVIDRAARAQAQLIDELLDMSRIVAGNVQLQLEPVLVSATLESVIAALQPAADAKSIEIERAIEVDAEPLLADGQRLQQVVSNLLNNAIKFTPPGGHVRVALETRPDGVRFSVADSGEGIAPEFLPFVFERFRQADGSITRKYGGLGLGLAIVRHLVEAHGGSVRAASEGIGRGATFTVELLLGKPSNFTGTVVAEDAPAARLAFKADPEEVALVRLDGVRVLVVDDEPDGLDMVTQVLTECGATVTPAGSADAALSLLRTGESDILISDIGMPLVDGYELLRRARASGHALPAIALTAFARREDHMRALQAGFAMHLAKPAEPSELVLAVARLARRHMPSPQVPPLLR